ncbi:MAG: hypothetical protein KY469_11880 [Actinobacteria bacterium]|nr:hypothetical protein [Actinomycetota bacterium]
MTQALHRHRTHLLVCVLCIALGPWLILATPAAAQNAQTVDVFVTVPHDSGPAGPDAPSASPDEPLPRTGASARDLTVIATALVALGTAVLKSTNSLKRASHA